MFENKTIKLTQHEIKKTLQQVVKSVLKHQIKHLITTVPGKWLEGLR